MADSPLRLERSWRNATFPDDESNDLPVPTTGKHDASFPAGNTPPPADAAPEEGANKEPSAPSPPADRPNTTDRPAPMPHEPKAPSDTIPSGLTKPQQTRTGAGRDNENQPMEASPEGAGEDGRAESENANAPAGGDERKAGAQQPKGSTTREAGGATNPTHPNPPTNTPTQLAAPNGGATPDPAKKDEEGGQAQDQTPQSSRPPTSAKGSAPPDGGTPRQNLAAAADGGAEATESPPTKKGGDHTPAKPKQDEAVGGPGRQSDATGTAQSKDARLPAVRQEGSAPPSHPPQTTGSRPQDDAGPSEGEEDAPNPRNQTTAPPDGNDFSLNRDSAPGNTVPPGAKAAEQDIASRTATEAADSPAATPDPAPFHPSPSSPLPPSPPREGTAMRFALTSKESRLRRFREALGDVFPMPPALRRIEDPFVGQHNDLHIAERMNTELSGAPRRAPKPAFGLDPQQSVLRRLQSGFARIVAKLAEDLASLPVDGDDEWDVQALLGRAMDRRPLRSCRISREREALVLIIDVSGSCKKSAAFFGSISALAAAHKDVLLLAGNNGRVEMLWEPLRSRWRQLDLGRWPFKGRTILFFGDHDGSPLICDASVRNRLTWFSNEVRADVSGGPPAGFRGHYVRCGAEADLLAIARRLR